MSGPRQSLGVFRHSSSRSRGDVGRVGRAGRRGGRARRLPALCSRRRASASRPSSTWRGDRRSLPPRRRRRAAPRCRRTLALASRGSLIPRSRRRHPRPGSTLVVLIVAAPPGARFVASLGGAVEPRVHAPDAVQSARIRGILPALASTPLDCLWRSQRWSNRAIFSAHDKDLLADPSETCALDFVRQPISTNERRFASW